MGMSTTTEPGKGRRNGLRPGDDQQRRSKYVAGRRDTMEFRIAATNTAII